MSGERYPEVWCVDLDAAGAALREIEQRTPRLSEADRLRAATLSDEAMRAEWLGAQTALRIVIELAGGSGWRGVAFTRGERGKPHLSGAPFSFNLSHAPGIALMAIARGGPVGVDVEHRRKVRIAVERRARIRDAGAAMDAAPLPCGDEDGFLQAWVRLEALAKADGGGIGRLLTRLGISGAGARAPVDAGLMREQAQAWLAAGPIACVRDLQLGAGVFAALACVEAPAVPAVRWLPADIEGLEKLVG